MKCKNMAKQSPSTYISLRLPVIIFFILTQSFCEFESYPRQDEIDSTINRYRSEQNNAERVRLVSHLLSEMKNPRNSADENLLRGLINRLVSEYRTEHDESILIALDATPIQAGFANYVCSVYYDLSAEDDFISRYSKTEDRAAIERCVGISFSREDINSKFGNHDLPQK